MSGLSLLSDGKRRFPQQAGHTSPLPVTAVVLMDALSSSGDKENRPQLCEILNSSGVLLSST